MHLCNCICVEGAERRQSLDNSDERVFIRSSERRLRLRQSTYTGVVD